MTTKSYAMAESTKREKYGDSRRCWIRSMQTIRALGYGSLSRIIFLLTFVTIAIYFERSFVCQFVRSLSRLSATMLFSLEMKFIGKRSQSTVLNSVILHFSCRINRDRVAAGWASRSTDLFSTNTAAQVNQQRKKNDNLPNLLSDHLTIVRITRKICPPIFIRLNNNNMEKHFQKKKNNCEIHTYKHSIICSS